MGTAQNVLAMLDIVKADGGIYRCNSPFHPGSNSEALVIKVEDEEHGTFYNHAAAAGEPESGTLYDLAKALGADITVGRSHVESTKRQYAGLDDYATMQGVSVDVFVSAGWKETTHMKRPALTFATANGMRWRFLDGDKPHYINPPAYEVCWYGLSRAIALATENKTPIILANGEASTVVAQHYNLPAFCKTAGENRIPDNLLDELREKWQGEILIALDCDEKGRHVAQTIKSEQLPKSIVVDLGLTDGGDLANFCKLHTTEVAPTLWRLKNKEADSAPIAVNSQPLSKAISELTRARLDKRGDIAELVNKAQYELDNLRSQVFRPPVLTQNQIITQAAMNFSEKNGQSPDGISGLRSGIRTIDTATKGFKPGTITTIIAATKHGKSTLVTSIAPALMRQAAGLIVSTEISSEYYINKVISAGLNIPVSRINSGTCSADEQREVMKAYALFRQYEVDYMEKRSPYLSDIKTALDAGNGKYKWLIIDSLSNLNSTEIGIYASTRANSKGLVEIAGDYNLAVLQTVQIGRNKKHSDVKIPGMNDATGAGDVENDSDLLIALYNHQVYVDSGDSQPDTNFPPKTAFVKVLADRWNSMSGFSATLSFVGESRLADFFNDDSNSRHMD